MPTSVKVEIAFTTDPYTGAPTWTDVTAYVSGFRTGLGRSTEVGEVEAGTAEIDLDNSDGRFTPGLTTGAYYPNVKPRREVRVRASRDNWVNSDPVFHGHITRWPVSFQPGSDVSRVTVQCSDGLSYLSGVELQDSYAAEVLADAPVYYWPLVDGPESAAAASLTGGNALQVRQNPEGGGDWAFSAKAAPRAELPDVYLQNTNIATGTGANNRKGYHLEAGAHPVPDTDLISLEIWVKAENSSNNTDDPIRLLGWSKGSFTDHNAATMNIGAQAVAGTFYGNALYQGPSTLPGTQDGAQAIATSDWTDLAWHHLVMTFNGSEMKFYVDGVLEATDSTVTGSWPVAPETFGDTVAVGGKVGSANWRGALAHAAVYNAVLSATRVAAHYNAGVNGFANEAENTRIGRILDLAGWPSSYRSLESGVSSLQAEQWDAGVDAAQLIKDAAKDAGGVVFCGPDGKIVFHSRHHRISVASTATLRESTNTAPVHEYEFWTDEDRIINEATATRTGAGSVRVVDEASKDAYGRRTTTLDLAVTDDEEARDAAGWIVYQNKDSRIRMNAVTFDPTTSAPLYDFVLTAEFGDRVTLAELSQYAPGTSMDFFIESIRHTVWQDGNTLQWRTTMDMSPSQDADGWVLEDNTYGLLDSTTILVY